MMKALFAILFCFVVGACASPKYSYYFDRHSLVSPIKSAPLPVLDPAIDLIHPEDLTASLPENSYLRLDPPSIALSENKVVLKTEVAKKKKVKAALREYVRAQKDDAPRSVKRDGKVSSFAVVGFVASLLAPIVVVLFLPLAITAIICSSIGLSRTRTDTELRGRGLALAGLIIGIVEIALILLVVALFVGLANAS